ncbi:hypothetical protein P8452_57026 [Trifolium repens]|nr:hypothetical protein P8452_57026 [Trifolium repens]
MNASAMMPSSILLWRFKHLCIHFEQTKVCFSNGYTAWGLSIHNQIGESIFSACKRESLSVEPVMAEALGIRWALQAAIDQVI